MHIRFQPSPRTRYPEAPRLTSASDLLTACLLAIYSSHGHVESPHCAGGRGPGPMQVLAGLLSMHIGGYTADLGCYPEWHWVGWAVGPRLHLLSCHRRDNAPWRPYYHLLYSQCLCGGCCTMLEAHLIPLMAAAKGCWVWVLWDLALLYALGSIWGSVQYFILCLGTWF